MSESERRFQRYVLAPDAFASQRAKGTGLAALLKGWKDCRVKDMSAAGALLLTKQEFSLGDGIEVELTEKGGKRLVFKGEVVNLGKDHHTNLSKVGVKLSEPGNGSLEAQFLGSLESRFRQSP
ncbi:TPA: PilZ domain-containing protein [Pseudomonas aeruginosa]|nr:PilZ domain-containing protein [Pseudomonas aeruginosa]HBP1602398.1 PilZ domain-containing protein [Pseudomonas aeruginosa]